MAGGGVKKQGSRGAGSRGEKPPTRGVSEAERSSASTKGAREQGSYRPQGARF
ncbi:asr0705 [Nostoc sp. PCC 7120 = FACHB-418]|nr:asr0705 [Nostoc sp. PCC 7120 = FACHB-418]